MSNTVVLNKEYIEPQEKVYVLQEPYVDDDGIYVPVHAYVQSGTASAYRCVMTKETFVEAYNKYVNNQRMYKGGWRKR